MIKNAMYCRWIQSHDRQPAHGLYAVFNPSASGAGDLRLRQSVAKTQHLNKIVF